MIEVNPPKSIIEQIFDQMFTELESCEIFETETIQKLRDMAAKDNLHKATLVEKILKSTTGDH